MGRVFKSLDHSLHLAIVTYKATRYDITLVVLLLLLFTSCYCCCLPVVVQVISTLKKITLQDNRNGEGEEEEDREGDSTSLDKPHDYTTASPRTPRTPHRFPQQQSQGSRSGTTIDDDLPPPSVSVDPSMLSPSHTTHVTNGGPPTDE